MHPASSSGHVPVANARAWARTGMLAAVVGALLIVVGLTTRTVADPIPVQVVPLHNTDAEIGTPDDCPDEPAWHLVLAPDNGTYRFVSVTFDLGGTIVRYETSDLIPNAGQLDNVFVPVPDGFAFDDLRRDTSFAEVSPAGPVKFVISHLCPDSSSTTPYPTTTTIAATTSTTLVSSTTSSSVPPETTTTEAPPSSSTMPPSTTTPAATTSTTTSSTTTSSTTTSSTTTSSTTTSTVASQGPTPTTTLPATSTSTTSTVPTTTVPTTSSSTTSTVASGGPVPTTGVPTTTTSTTVPRTLVVTGAGGSRTMIMVGALLLLVGTSLVLGARIRNGDDPPVVA